MNDNERELVAELAQAPYGQEILHRKRLTGFGKSTRAIGHAVGVHHDTVADDIRATVGNPTVDQPRIKSLDGRARPATPCTQCRLFEGVRDGTLDDEGLADALGHGYWAGVAYLLDGPAAASRFQADTGGEITSVSFPHQSGGSGPPTGPQSPPGGTQ